MRNDPSLDLSTSEGIGKALRHLRPPLPPEKLGTSLRVLASKERQRADLRRTVPGFCTYLYGRLRHMTDDLMRPFALPFAGGVSSAVLLFSMFVIPAYPVRAIGGYDVPTMLTTVATLKISSDLGMSGDDVVVDVTVDEQGRMADYRIVQGPSVLIDLALRRRLENMLLFTQFVPATAFGMPTPARLRITIRSSQVDVKG